MVFIWEHQFKYQLEINAALKRFVSTLDIQDRLDPRESFLGGQTKAITLQGGERRNHTILRLYKSLYVEKQILSIPRRTSYYHHRQFPGHVSVFWTCQS